MASQKTENEWVDEGRHGEKGVKVGECQVVLGSGLPLVMTVEEKGDTSSGCMVVMGAGR